MHKHVSNNLPNLEIFIGREPQGKPLVHLVAHKLSSYKKQYIKNFFGLTDILFDDAKKDLAPYITGIDVTHYDSKNNDCYHNSAEDSLMLLEEEKSSGF